MPTHRYHNHHHILRDLSLLALSFLVAAFVGSSDVFRALLTASQGHAVFASFVAGFFFTSFFTFAPSTVVLGKISGSYPLWIVAVSGALGAVIANYLLFEFARDSIRDDIDELFGSPYHKRFSTFFSNRKLRWVLPALAIIIIVSPLPDELAVALFGITNMRTRIFAPLAFASHLVGIAAIGGIAHLF